VEDVNCEFRVIVAY